MEIGGSEQSVIQGGPSVSVGAVMIHSGVTVVPLTEVQMLKAGNLVVEIIALRMEIAKLGSRVDFLVSLESRFWYQRWGMWFRDRWNAIRSWWRSRAV